MTRRTRISLLAAIVVVAATAVIVPSIVGAASDSNGNMATSVTPDPITAQCPSTTGTNLAPIDLKNDWKGSVESATVSGPGISGSQTLSDNTTFTIPANTPGFTCGQNATYTFVGRKNGVVQETDALAVPVNDVNSITSTAVPATVQVQCAGSNTTGRLAAQINLNVTFHTSNVGVDNATVSGTGLTTPANISRSTPNAGATGSAPIPAGTLGMPCTGSTTYTFNAMKGSTSVETDTALVTFTPVPCPSGVVCS